MNKRVFVFLAFILSILSGHEAVALTIHRAASVEIVGKPAGIKPLADGAFSVGASSNNVQVAYLSDKAQENTMKVKYTMLKNNEKINPYARFRAQYE
jgi:hypothetical protein